MNLPTGFERQFAGILLVAIFIGLSIIIFKTFMQK